MRAFLFEKDSFAVAGLKLRLMEQTVLKAGSKYDVFAVFCLRSRFRCDNKNHGMNPRAIGALNSLETGGEIG